MVQRLTDSQQPLLTATYVGRLTLPRVGYTLATFSRKYPVGMVAALVLGMIALLAVLAPMVAPYDPNFQHFADLQQAPSTTYLSFKPTARPRRPTSWPSRTCTRS